MVVYIYTLSHPLTGEIRYVGKTSHLKRRFANHCSDCMRPKVRTHTTNWLYSLRKAGLRPIMEVVEESSVSDFTRDEQYWIAQCRAWGFSLTNQTEGGGGMYGFVSPHLKSDKMRQATSKRHKGKVIPQEMRDRISSSLKGHKNSEASNQKRREYMATRVHPKQTLYYLFERGTMSFKGTYYSSKTVAEHLGIKKRTVVKVVAGDLPFSAINGYIIHNIKCKK